MLVGILSLIEKEAIEGVQYQPDLYYNPIQDANNNWIISVEEMQGTTDPDYLWVRDIPLIEYVPKDEPFELI